MTIQNKPWCGPLHQSAEYRLGLLGKCDKMEEGRQTLTKFET